MTDESKNQLRADILSALQDPQPVAGNSIPANEMTRLLALGQQLRAGLIRQTPLGTTAGQIEAAERQHGDYLMSRPAGQWTAEDRAFILRGVNDWMKDNR